MPATSSTAKNNPPKKNSNYQKSYSGAPSLQYTKKHPKFRVFFVFFQSVKSFFCEYTTELRNVYYICK